MRSIHAVIVTILFITACEGPKEQSSALLLYAGDDGEKKKVSTPADWKRKRAGILAGMEQVMGPLPWTEALAPPKVRVRDSLRESSYTRYRIDISVAEREDLPVYLYVPAGENRSRRPAMLVLHETGAPGKDIVDGMEDFPNRALARELAERGYVVIAPDYPGMGELGNYDFGNDAYESGTMKGIFNHMRCVDLLQSRTDVDPGRIGVIGHSLGGHNAIFAGAFDSRLKVVVSSCGWTLFDFYDIGEEASRKYGGRLGPWAQDRYMPLIRERFNLDPDKIPFDFDGAIAAIAPRPFFSNSPSKDSNFDVGGVKEGVAAAREVYELLGAPDNLQVRYPEAGHDFPRDVRLEAYQFIDKALDHNPNAHGPE